jgi:hypothetical protein
MVQAAIEQAADRAWNRGCMKTSAQADDMIVTHPCGYADVAANQGIRKCISRASSHVLEGCCCSARWTGRRQQGDGSRRHLSAVVKLASQRGHDAVRT